MKTVVLLISHPLRSPEAVADFESLIARVGLRFPDFITCGAFLDPQGQGISSVVWQACAGSSARVFCLPYLLHRGRHAQQDIPAIIEDLRKMPGVHEAHLLPGLWDEPLLEDALVERVAAATTDALALPTTGAQIEQSSHDIIDRRLALTALTQPQKIVARRIIHATADFSFARTLSFHPEAISRGVEALRNGRPVICDVNMLKAGITRCNSEVICAINEDLTINSASELGITRAAAAIDRLAERINGAILAVGNAPTALWRMLELGLEPALVIGLPVGFVGAREAKQALIESSRVHISNFGPRGGSPAAAAAVNALALLCGGEG